MQASRGDALLETARQSVASGRLIAGRALLEAARALGACADEADEMDGRLLLQEGRIETALHRCGTAITRNPANWRLRCLRADLRLAADDAAGAAADAAEAVVAAPREAAPKAALGTALLALGHAGDASACLVEAVAGEPSHVGYRLVSARALAADGDPAKAQRTLREAIVLRPRAASLRIAAIRLAVGLRDFATALDLADAARQAGVLDACILGLRGHALSCLGRDDAAVEAYQEALQLAPEDRYVRHLVAAAGLVAAPPRASPEYVRVLFDGFADHFEADLMALDYRVPGLVRAALLAERPEYAEPGAGSGRSVLDLGCGTGLMAVVLSDLALGPFTGIDLSGAMLAEAAAKQLYERLIEGDICDGLDGSGPFGVVLAADVMPYLGDPARLLRSVWSLLEPGGLFALTIEALAADDPAPYRLGRRARYAHRPDDICDAARAAGFAVRSRQLAVLRCDTEGAVDGCVLVLAREAAAS